MITKQVNGETRYYKKDAGTALAPVSNVGLDRFVSVNDLANIVFDDNGYVIDTEYYEWKFDKNADGDLTNDGTGTNGFAKKGGSAYLTQDSTANGKALDVEDFGDVYTVQGTSKNMVVTKTDGKTFTMPGKGVTILDGVYEVRVSGSNKAAHTNKDGELFDIEVQGWKSDVDYVTITTTTGSTTTYWKDQSGSELTKASATAENTANHDRYIAVSGLSSVVFKDTDESDGKELSADAFTINPGYHKITFASGDSVAVARTGNWFNDNTAGGFAKAGDVVNVTLASSVTGLVVKKTSDDSNPVNAEGSATNWKFTMPDYPVSFDKGAQVLSVKVNNATAYGIVKGDDVATSTDGTIPNVDKKSWGKFVTITDADGAFYTVASPTTLTKQTGKDLDDADVYVPVADLGTVVWSTATPGSTPGSRTFADDYTITTGYFEADFRGGEIEKTKGSTVAIKGEDAESFGDFGRKFVPRGTVLVVRPGVDANNYYIGDVHVTTDPVEIIMGTTCTEIEIKPGADDPAVNVTPSISESSLKLVKAAGGDDPTAQLTVSLSKGTIARVTWTSSTDATATVAGDVDDDSVATVTFVADGETTISAVITDTEGTTYPALECTVTCATVSVSLDKTTATIAASGTADLVATFDDGDSDLTVTKYDWASSDATKATVTAGGTATSTTGTVTHVAAGSATITVTATLSNGATVSATCAVTCS